MRSRYILACRMVSASPFPDYRPPRRLLTVPRLGFAVVGEYKDENIKVAQGTAFEQMLNWVKEH